MAVTVPLRRAEEARARMLELFPEGFEEVESGEDVELAAYTDPGGEERLWHAFGAVRGVDVEEGWEERWRSFHRPVRIGDLWIGPPWEQAPADAARVVIDPGRAFGTGSHATTRLCLDLLRDQPRGSLLDLGCGSGVLAIAAARLGFAPVHAVDIDPLAVEATAHNAHQNRVRLVASLADVLEDPLPHVDTVVANIVLDVVTEVAARVDCRRLITSGYLLSDRPGLPPFRHLRRVSDQGWAADLWEAATE